MKISLEWIKDYIHFDHSPELVAELLTNQGMEVEDVEYPDRFSGVLVGRITSCEKIAGGRNSICTIDIGERSIIQICGAPNIRQGLLAPVILPGGSLPDGREITPVEIEGVLSKGMVCSQAELGLGTEADVIWELPKNSDSGETFTVGTDFRRYFCEDAVFKLEITPNRPDCLSHIGIAREIAAGLGLELKIPSPVCNETGRNCSDVLRVDILAGERCPRYCGRVLEGVKIQPSPRWMQRRLSAVGIRPINNVVDVTNYVMMEFGNPLHAFDFTRIRGSRIVVKTAHDGDKFITLDEKEHNLTGEDLLICDGEEGVALAGVMGGLNSEISSRTTGLLLECAYFQPQGVRFTARRLAIDSESSYRFERGVDPNAIPRVIDRTAQLIQLTGGGEILRGRVDKYVKPVRPANIKLRPRRVNRILGGKLRADKISKLLRSIDLKVEADNGNFTIDIPTFRPDLVKEIDLIEEIARLNGYDKVKPSSRSLVSLNVEPMPDESFDNLLRCSLVAQGLQEVLTHSMRRRGMSGILGLKPVFIDNPISADFAQLRSDLLAPLLEMVSYNLNRGMDTIRAFEIGSIFESHPEKKVVETRQAAGVITGKAGSTFWGEQRQEVDFFDIKGIVESLFRQVSLDNHSFSSYLINEAIFAGGQKVEIDGITAGGFGEIKKGIIERFDIEQPVFMFYLDYRLIQRNHDIRPRFKPFSRYPEVKRDISLIFNEDIPAAQIKGIIEGNGGGILAGVEIFDLYRGKQVGEGKKSIAFSMKFQVDDRTLTDEEVDQIQEKILKELERMEGKLRFIHS